MTNLEKHTNSKMFLLKDNQQVLLLIKHDLDLLQKKEFVDKLKNLNTKFYH
jgi:hypothetical protein